MPSWTSRMAFRSSGSSEISVMSCASRASTKTEEAVSKASGTDGFFGLPAAAADPVMASRSTKAGRLRLIQHLIAKGRLKKRNGHEPSLNDDIPSARQRGGLVDSEQVCSLIDLRC